MFKNIVAFVAVLPQILFGESHAKHQPQRVFSQGYIEGLYGRFFEYTEDVASSPCPRVIDHFSRGFPSALGNSWIIPHDHITENGVSCNDRGVLILNSFHTTSKMPDRLKTNLIAVETFSHMKRDSTGFWMGADARTCGSWVFPKPSFVFFVKEFDRDITTSYRLRLERGHKYMVVVAQNFTCIYLDVPRSSPNPDVIIIPGDGTSGTETEPIPDSSHDSQPQSSTPKEPSGTNEDTSDMDTGDPDLSIINIQNGATPLPTRTSSPGTIQDILEIEHDDDSITAILNEDGISEEASNINELFDLPIQAGDSLCFPGSATVELTNGSIIRMEQLSTGDDVRIGDGYSRVFGFTHRDPEARQSFIRLMTLCGKSIALTTGHYLYVNNKLIPAGEVRQGDRLRVITGEAIVETVDIVIRNGLYNPQTLDGTIMVNGVKTSTYTTAVETKTAHSLLLPLRAMFSLLGISSCAFDKGANRLTKLMLSGGMTA